MCFVFTCGEHTFRKELEGYDGVVCRCYNCGNHSARVIKLHPWFTFCFIPIIPYTIKGHTDVECHICNFRQPLEHRPDVQALKHGGNGVPLQHHGQQDHGGGGPRPPGNQGWGEHQSPPPGNQPMRYG